MTANSSADVADLEASNNVSAMMLYLEKR